MTSYAMLKHYCRTMHILVHGSFDKTGLKKPRTIPLGALRTKWLHFLSLKVLLYCNEKINHWASLMTLTILFLVSWREHYSPPPLSHSKVLKKFCTHTSTFKFLTKTGNNPKILLEETHISQKIGALLSVLTK
jgi:hypothetical protein